jgi:hypothetical protein
MPSPAELWNDRVSGVVVSVASFAKAAAKNRNQMHADLHAANRLLP